MFNQITFLNKNKNLINLKVYFRKQIKKIPFLTLKNKASSSLQNKCNVDFSYEKNKKIFFGYIFESNEKLSTRKKYHEKLFQKKVKLSKNEIIIPYDNRYNFIEKITLSAMKFLKKKSPEKKNKWYLAYIYLKRFSEEKKLRDLKLRYLKKNEKLYYFEIVIKKNKNGNMIFIKK